jgi:hypothetical protein
MKTIILKRVIAATLAPLALSAILASPATGESRAFDAQAQVSSVGALVAWLVDEQSGERLALLGSCSGTLIHPQVFLTAGHCVAPSFQFPGGLPPFIKLFAVFSARFSSRIQAHGSK